MKRIEYNEFKSSFFHMLICRKAWNLFKIPAKVKLEYEASAEMVPDLIWASYFFGPKSDLVTA